MQRGPRGKSKQQEKPEQLSAPRLFLAAVRYRNGQSELFRIKKANNLDDARQVIMDTQVNVHLVLISELKSTPLTSQEETVE